MHTTIKHHIERAALVGWRPRPRIGLTIYGGRAVLRIQYRSDLGMWPIHAGDPEDGNGIDLRDMPGGVSVMTWQAPPDDVIELAEVPGRRDIARIADTLGRRVAHRLVRGDGAIVYWLDTED